MILLISEIDNEPSSAFCEALINLIFIRLTTFKLSQYIINNPVITNQAISYIYFTNYNKIKALADVIELLYQVLDKIITCCILLL